MNPSTTLSADISHDQWITRWRSILGREITSREAGRLLRRRNDLELRLPPGPRRRQGRVLTRLG